MNNNSFPDCNFESTARICTGPWPITLESSEDAPIRSWEPSDQAYRSYKMYGNPIYFDGRNLPFYTNFNSITGRIFFRQKILQHYNPREIKYFRGEIFLYILICSAWAQFSHIVATVLIFFLKIHKRQWPPAFAGAFLATIRTILSGRFFKLVNVKGTWPRAEVAGTPSLLGKLFFKVEF